MCSEQFTEECFVVDMQAAMGFKKTKKRSTTKDAAPTLFSFTKLAVPIVPSEKRAKVLKRNSLVASHTDSLLIINFEINIIRPDLN